MNPILLSLQDCNLFKLKSLEEIDSLLSHIHYSVDTFKENEVVFSPYQIADKMGIILSGAVDVQKLFPCGKVVILNRRTASDLIAEASLFSKTKYYPSTISACTTCQILFIHKDELLKLFLIDEGIMSCFLESVSNRVLALNRKIEVLSLTSIAEKIAYFLLYDHYDDDNSTILLPFSKKAWAEHMNVSRPSLLRELKKLEIDGLISIDKRVIQIKDFQRLKEILLD
ncbi:transcriptional regulator Crp/Fnr family [Clostridium aceticum]|uniref:Transcriptional regulator Crp/Fnr family n=1 Tax=Clostridium aceticum TaxID=84022 RepID=A0A0D8I9K4_9CLOT|nr:Crp/Fnr family transcriptional regulator [Clostridium aceticum]AKL96389.1 transcriptional regulator Crp/Fnr family [Clostridium aceticum]KJF26965.1 hypothetical protein TZ02_10595 [Clostridium aceticum]